MCSYSELFWSVVCRIRTETDRYFMSPYSVRMQKNVDHKQFSRSAYIYIYIYIINSIYLPCMQLLMAQS